MKNLITTLLICLSTLASVGQNIESFSGKNGKIGLRDFSGKVLVAPKYDGVHCSSACCDSQGEDVVFIVFYEGAAQVNIGSKKGFIDTTGKEIVACKYDEASWFSEGLSCVKLNGKLGFIDKSGKTKIAFKFIDASSFQNGLSAVKLKDKWGFIDKTGKEIIASKYDDVIENFFGKNENDLKAKVRLGTREFYIDKKGNEIKDKK